ncbi:DNA-processing protein DprA [Thalassiella azotivora]
MSGARTAADGAAQHPDSSGWTRWVEDDRLARAAWSRLTEPDDDVAGRVLHAVGATAAVRHVLAGTPLDHTALDLGDDGRARTRLAAGTARWRTRAQDLAPERDVAVVERLGGRLVVPGDAEWPVALEVLGHRAPACLWVRGRGDLAGLLARSASLVGARACTAYGERVAADLAAGLADQHVTVLSGGAFGVDAAAHRGALAVGGGTVAVLACGVDRDYPVAHRDLLARVRDEGAVVSELPPGSAVTRYRFLQRNRLVAAATAATVVVEAAWRSGAYSTAAHAAALGRPLGAVPGPVTSAASAGCHRILRELDAVCVTGPDDVLELVGAPPGGVTALEAPVLEAPVLEDSVPEARTSPASRAGGPTVARAHDGLSEGDLRVLDSLPVRAARPARDLVRVAALPEPQVVAALGRLTLLGLATAVPGADGDRWWRRSGRR